MRALLLLAVQTKSDVRAGTDRRSVATATFYCHQKKFNAHARSNINSRRVDYFDEDNFDDDDAVAVALMLLPFAAAAG